MTKRSFSIKISNIYIIVLTWFVTLTSFSQTIINTENMMDEIDERLSYNLNFKGDLNFGNIELIQFSTAHQFSKMVDRHLFRVLVNYDYIKQSGNEISSDFTGQFRYNYKMGSNSIFGFIQAQNVKSLRMNHRYISGGGYRHRLLEKEKDYFDGSVGMFFEDEMYDQNLTTQRQVFNWRYSLSSFCRLSITDKIYTTAVVYYQINSSISKDYRLFIQPRLYLSLSRFDIFLDGTYRFHSTPYIDVKRTDSSLELGIEFTI